MRGGQEGRATSGLVGGGILPGVERTLAAGSAPQAQPGRVCVRAAAPAGTRLALIAHTHTHTRGCWAVCFRVE